MFKKCLFIILVILAAGSLSAADLTLGVYAGINLGWFSGDDWEDIIDAAEAYYGEASSESRLCFSIAGFLDIALSESFSLQPELQFTSGKGGAKITDSVGDTVELTETINTLVIPVLGKYKIPAGKGKINIFGGPALIMILGDIEYKEEYNIDGDTSTDTSTEEPDNKAGFGFTIGAGYEVPMGNGKFITDLCFSKSLTDFFDNDDTRLNTLGLNIGYGFNL